MSCLVFKMDQASDSAHGGPRWVIARVHDPDSFMDTDGVDMDVVDTGAVDRPGSVEAEVGVEVLVCTTSEDWWTTGSPSRVQDWICERAILTSALYTTGIHYNPCTMCRDQKKITRA